MTSSSTDQQHQPAGAPTSSSTDQHHRPLAAAATTPSGDAAPGGSEAAALAAAEEASSDSCADGSGSNTATAAGEAAAVHGEEAALARAEEAAPALPGIRLPTYSWNQSIQEVNLEICVDECCASDMRVVLLSRRICVRRRGEVVVEGRLHDQIRCEHSVWYLDGGTQLVLSLEKLRHACWPCLFEYEHSEQHDGTQQRDREHHRDRHDGSQQQYWDHYDGIQRHHYQHDGHRTPLESGRW